MVYNIDKNILKIMPNLPHLIDKLRNYLIYVDMSVIAPD